MLDWSREQVFLFLLHLYLIIPAQMEDGATLSAPSPQRPMTEWFFSSNKAVEKL